MAFLLMALLLFACQSKDAGQPVHRQNVRIVDMSAYSDGLSMVKTEDGKYGYIDTARQMAIPPVYDYAGDFSEGLALVGQTDEDGAMGFMVIDTLGQPVFGIALDSCMLAPQFHQGVLWYKDMQTGREGYLDRKGYSTVAPRALHAAYEPDSHAMLPAQETVEPRLATPENSAAGKKKKAGDAPRNLRQMAASNPFFAEARKVLSGNLQEYDAARRTIILNFMEHLRTAYTTKDIDFLEQLYSDEALIIVGHVVKRAGRSGVSSLPQVSYNIHDKRTYLERLRKVFAINKTVSVRFSDFSIKRHPTMDGIYGVTTRQAYRSDRYGDDGWLFLLWDFRDVTAPKIHVRTWQESYDASHNVLPRDSVFGMHDFNLN